MWRMKIVKGLLLITLITTGACIYFLTLFDNGQFTPEVNTQLNAVNFSWFVLREVSFFVSLILTPILTIIMFNSEVKSKKYYLIMCRPFNRMKLLLSKWITLFMLMAGVTLFILLAGIIGGALLYSMPEYVQFFDDPIRYNIVEGYLYTIKYYTLFYFILVANICLCSSIALLMPNAMIAFFSTLFMFIMPVYFMDDFLYLLLPTQFIFESLSVEGLPNMYVLMFFTIALFVPISSLTWKNRDFY